MDIFFVGSGNVATNFSLKLREKGENILGICSRKKEKAAYLSNLLECTYYTNIDDIPYADIFFLCVQDDAIFDITQVLHNKFHSSLFIHTSGSTSISSLYTDSFNTQNAGVIYPLQTFNVRNRQNLFLEYPIFIEASNNFSYEKINYLAKHLSKDIYVLDSDKRRLMHLAAVFANNFTNHCMALAQKQMERCNLPFQLLNSLVCETIKQLKENKAELIQSGPAIRNDNKTLSLHKDLLEDNIQKELYNIISQSIFNLSKK